MALTPTQTWKDAAAAGTIEPTLLFELKPTTLYSEKNCRGDWSVYTGSTPTLDISAVTDELKLAAAVPDYFSSEAQAYTDNKAQFNQDEPVKTLVGGTWTTRHQLFTVDYFQIVNFETGFRLKKFYLALYNKENKGKASFNISLMTNFRDPRNILSVSEGGWTRSRTKSPSDIAEIFGDPRVKTLCSIIVDCSRDAESSASGGPVWYTDPGGHPWREFDFTDKQVWIPGGQPIAILIQCTDFTDVRFIELCGSSDRTSYSKGDFYKYNAELQKFRQIEGDLAFKFLGYGYASTGTGTWRFDVGEAPDANSVTGEIEIKDIVPPGTSITYEKREAVSEAVLDSVSPPAWGTFSDGAVITKRWIDIKVTMTPDSTRFLTPRVLSLRCAYKASHKFMLASKPLFGYPNCVAEPPDYTAEGDPLEGTLSASDTSKITLIDSGGMISRLFELYPMKNDEVAVSLGFNTSSFLETDYLPIKAFWIEDWQIQANKVILDCYDQFVVFKQAETPTTDNPPENTEQVIYSAWTMAEILQDLLQRARIRRSKVLNSNFTALTTAFPWEFNHSIEQPTKVEEVASAVTKHVTGFLCLDENGKWVCRWVDFNAVPVVEIEENDILL